MNEIQKVFLTVYILITVITIIPTIRLLYGIYITKEYKNALDAGYTSWMSIYFFCIAQLFLLGTFIYSLL